jgi:hypothetical protein
MEFKRKHFAACAILFLPLGLPAAQAGLAGGWALPEKSGAFHFSYTQRYRVDSVWYDNVNRLQDPARGQQLVWRNGRAVSRKIVSIGAALGWQAGPRDYFGLHLPAHFAELSDWYSHLAPVPPINDPAIVRRDQIGDLDLHWRRQLLQRGAVRMIVSLGGVAPLGYQPFETSHTLVGLGAGSFEGSAGLHSAWQSARQSWWADGRFHYNTGYQASVGPGAFLAPDRQWPEGNAFVRPGARTELVAGYLVDWHLSPAARHSFALEARYLQQAHTRLGSREIAGSGSTRLDILPQAHFRFTDTLTLVAGFGYPLAGNGGVGVYCGPNGICDPDIHARADFQLR